MSIRIGVDLGGTNIALGLVDENHKIIKKMSVPTDVSSADAVADGIADAVMALLSGAGLTLANTDAIGIGAPGIVDAERGVIDYVCNLPMRYYPLAEAVAFRLGVEKGFIRLENDANAAALGEMLAGAGNRTEHKMRHFMLITLGTGVGGGIIADGRILPSFNHAGGELGHTVISVDGVPCACGRRGCAEAYCSATALVRQAREAGLSQITGAKDVFDLAREGNGTAKAVLDVYFNYVAVMLANFINIFQPQMIAVGGGVSGAGDELILPLRERIFPDMIYNRDQPEELYTQLVCATLGGDAGIIGAAGIIDAAKNRKETSTFR